MIDLDADIPDKVAGYWLQVSQQVSQRDEFITDELTNHLFQVTPPQTLPNFLQQKWHFRLPGLTTGST